MKQEYWYASPFVLFFLGWLLVQIEKFIAHWLNDSRRPRKLTEYVPPTKEFEIRIVSDGTPAGTKILDKEGRVLSMVQTVDWVVTAGEGVAQATIVVAKVPVELLAQEVDRVEVPHLVEGDLSNN